MSWETNLEELITKIVKTAIPMFVIEGVVTNVYEDSCDIKIESGITLFKVRLHTVLNQKKGILIKPLKDSKVLCGIVENNPNDAFIIRCTEVDTIIINEGKNGGVTITPKLVDELKKNNEILQALLNTINGSPVTEPGNGSPSALQLAIKTALAGKKLGDFSKIENKKIKH